jgi:radical SAM superfamily enzyme YgiQ (UPF0313 family)
MKVHFVEFSFEKWFNTGIAALSAFLKRAGHDVSLLRTDFETNDEDFVRKIRELGPGLIGFSSMTFQWEGVKRFANLAKKAAPEIPIVVGGYHPTFWPDEVVGSPFVDYMVRGEGEDALLELVNALETGGDPSGIKNLWMKKPDGTVVKNDVRPPIQELDSLPNWDRDLFNFAEVMEHTGRGTIFHEKYLMPVAAGRGCPYTCTYCSNDALLNLYKGMGRFTRARSVRHFMNELTELCDKYQVKKFEFWDEIFGVNIPWLKEFAEVYSKELGLPFTAFLRVEQCNYQVLNLLKKANCSMILCGVEQGDEEYRRKYLDRKMSNQTIIEAFRRSREVGIETTSLNMIGLPYETKDLIRSTIELNRQLEADVVCIFIYQAFVGTDLFEICRKEGYLPETDQTKLVWYENPNMAIKQPSLTHEELMDCYKEFREVQAEMESKRVARRAASGHAPAPV